MEVETKTIKKIMEQFKGTEPAKKIYNYNVINTYILLNYVLFKADGKSEFEPLLNQDFNEKIGIEESVYFFKHGYYSPRADGNISNMFSLVA